MTGFNTMDKSEEQGGSAITKIIHKLGIVIRFYMIGILFSHDLIG